MYNMCEPSTIKSKEVIEDPNSVEFVEPEKTSVMDRVVNMSGNCDEYTKGTKLTWEALDLIQEDHEVKADKQCNEDPVEQGQVLETLTKWFLYNNWNLHRQPSRLRPENLKEESPTRPHPTKDSLKTGWEVNVKMEVTLK